MKVKYLWTSYVGGLVLLNILFLQLATCQARQRINTPSPHMFNPMTNGISISINYSFDLEFGEDLLPGVDRIIYPTDPVGRGGFQIEGEGGEEVFVSFILPSELTPVGIGTISLPVAFAGDYAGYGTDPMGNNLTLFNPTEGTQFILSPMPNYIFLGGRAIPETFQPAGEYSGTVIIEIEYTAE